MSAGADNRQFGRSAGTLSAGVGVSGLLTYIFFALASHNLGATKYGELVVMWAAVFVTISVLHRPIEQFLSRSIADHRARGVQIGTTLRNGAVLMGVISVAFVIVALALRGPLQKLFGEDHLLYWTYVATTTIFALSFFARGFLAGSGRFGYLAALLVMEGMARTLFALSVALGVATGQDPIVLGVLAAPIASLLVVPFAVRSHARREAPVAIAPSDGGASGLRHSSAFAAAVFLVMLSEQIFLNAGPLLLRGFEGPEAAGFIFNVLMLARAPLVVFQGIAISLLPHLTRLRSRGSGEADKAFGVSIEITLRAIVVFTAFVAVIVAAAGPTLMQIAFGEEFSYDRAGLLIVTAAMGLYLASTTLNQALLAQGQARRAAFCWIGCAVVFLGWSLIDVLDPARRIEIGFAAASAVLFLLLLRLYRDPHPVAADVLTPGSGDELGARLALADEAS